MSGHNEGIIISGGSFSSKQTVVGYEAQAIQQTYNVDNEGQSLAEAAAEIQQLLDQLSQIYPTTTVSEKGTVAAKAMEEIEKKPDTKIKIINALKAGGIAALIELTNNPVVKILTPMLESLVEEAK